MLCSYFETCNLKTAFAIGNVNATFEQCMGVIRAGFAKQSQTVGFSFKIYLSAHVLGSGICSVRRVVVNISIEASL